MRSGTAAGFDAISQLLNPASIVQTMRQVQAHDETKRKNEAFKQSVDDLNFRASQDSNLDKRIQSVKKQFPNALSSPEEFHRFNSHLTQMEMGEGMIAELENQGMLGSTGIGDFWRKTLASNPDAVINDMRGFVVGQHAAAEKQALINAKQEQEFSAQNFASEAAQDVLMNNEGLSLNDMIGRINESTAYTAAQKPAIRKATEEAFHTHLAEQSRQASADAETRRVMDKQTDQGIAMEEAIAKQTEADTKSREQQRLADIAAEEAALKQEAQSAMIESFRGEFSEEAMSDPAKFAAAVRASGEKIGGDLEELLSNQIVLRNALARQNLTKSDNEVASSQMIADMDWVTTRETGFVRDAGMDRLAAARGELPQSESIATRESIIEPSITMPNEAIINNTKWQEAAMDFTPNKGSMKGLPGLKNTSVIRQGGMNYQVSDYGKGRVGVPVSFDGNDLTYGEPVPMVKGQGTSEYGPGGTEKWNPVGEVMAMMNEAVPRDVSPYKSLVGSAKAWTDFLSKNKGEDPILTSLRSDFVNLKLRNSESTGKTDGDRVKAAHQWVEFEKLKAAYNAYITKSYNE